MRSFSCQSPFGYAGYAPLPIDSRTSILNETSCRDITRQAYPAYPHAWTHGALTTPRLTEGGPSSASAGEGSRSHLFSPSEHFENLRNIQAREPTHG